MYRVHGSVIDRTGRACPKATVEILPEFSFRDRPETTLEADENGKFTVVLPLTQPHDLKASAPGLVTLRPIRFGFRPCGMFRISETEIRDENIEPIVLAAGNDLRGRVSDETGRPVIHGYARVQGSDYHLQFTAYLDNDGRFVVHNAPQDLYSVSINADGYCRGSDQKVAVLDGLGADMAVTVVHNGAISGRIVAPQPIEGAKAFFSSDGYHHWFRFQEVKDGCFELKDRDPGRYEVVVRAPGWVGCANVTLAPGETAEPLVSLEPAPHVRLHLTDPSGQPAAHREVYVEEEKGVGAQGTTDESGNVEFTDLTRGTYEVHLGTEYRDHFPIAKRVVVQGDVALDLPIPELATIRGRVVGPKGVSFYSMEFSTAEVPRGALGNGSFSVGADGSFEIRDLPAAGVWLEANGSSSGRGSVRALARFELHAGVNEITFDVPECGSARIRVLGPNGVALDRFTPVELRATRLNAPNTLLIDQKREDDGVFTFSGLAPGRYRIDAWPGSLALVTRALGVQSLKTTPVEIEVASGAHLEKDLVVSIEER